jgi:hypothetical protein
VSAPGNRFSQGCAALVLAAGLAGAPPALAQGGATDRAAARALFEEGLACADREDWTCAADRFERAHALRPSPVIGSNLGHALVELGRLVEGTEVLRTAAQDPGATPQLRADAEAAIAECAPRIGRLTLAVTGPREGVDVAIDGRVIAPSTVGVPVPADPGDHAIEARRAGAVVATASVHVDPGAAATAELLVPGPATSTATVLEPAMLEPRPGADLAPALDVAPRRAPEPHEEWWFWTIVGGVALGAAIGVTAGVAASQTTVLPSGSLGTFDGR